MAGLWTPTDWAVETQLRIEYIKWLVETNSLPGFRIININLSGTLADPETLLKLFSETGIMFVSSLESGKPPVYTVPTFEEWRRQKATPEEKKELARLRSIQKNRTRWFTQEEFDRLNELAHKL